MNKTNSFVKYLKQINNLINNQLEKNLNRLKFDNLINLARSNKIILTFVAFLLLFVIYLLLPTLYKQSDISKKLELNLLEKFNLEIKLTNKINYNFFPKPHFKIEDVSLSVEEEEISNIKETDIYISLGNLFSLDKIEITDVILKNANFNLKKDNYKYFINLLQRDFGISTLNIRDSNIFYRNSTSEVLFFNKIHNMKYYYDEKESKNILNSKNEIFNITYEVKIFYNDSNLVFTELDLSLIKLYLENELLNSDNIYYGKANIIFDKLKSTFAYKIDQNLFEFKFFDKLENPKFEYDGLFNFKPFSSSVKGETKKLNLSYLINTNAFLSQLIKTEILNNKNIDFKLNIYAENIYNNINFKDVKLHSKIQEGLIDIDETYFKWKDTAEFNFSNSLIFVKEGELILDGNLSIDIKDNNQIYKFLLTPKKHRNKIKKIDFNFTYNFDRKTANLKDIRLDGDLNQKVNKILSYIIFKKDNLQNRIYLKNILNEALKNYDG